MVVMLASRIYGERENWVVNQRKMSHHCCTKQKVKRGLWSPEEDEKLLNYIANGNGNGSWSSVPNLAGLERCGKSCRLRWINYLRPDLKRGSFSPQEERIIIDIHRIVGNRWAQIAKHLPGRTDNEVKNFWNSGIKKKLLAQGIDPNTHNVLPNITYNNNNHQYNYKIAPKPLPSSSSFLNLTSQMLINPLNYMINPKELIANSPSPSSYPSSLILHDMQSSSGDELIQIINPRLQASSMGNHVAISSSSSSFDQFGLIDDDRKDCMWGGRGGYGEPQLFQYSSTVPEEIIMQPEKKIEVICEKIRNNNLDDYKISGEQSLNHAQNNFDFDFDFVESMYTSNALWHIL